MGYNRCAAFNVIKLIKGNPMILMLLVGAAITLGGPLLLSSLDPEGMQEVNERSQGMHKSLQGFQQGDLAGSLSKYLAGAVDGQSEVKEVVEKATGQTGASASGVQVGAGGGGGGTPGKGKGGKKRR